MQCAADICYVSVTNDMAQSHFQEPYSNGVIAPDVFPASGWRALFGGTAHVLLSL